MADEIKYLADTDLIKKLSNLKGIKPADDYKITVHMPTAKQDTIDIIGQEKYDELTGEEADADEKAWCASGEAYFALSYIVPAINIVSSGAGITKSTGFKDSRVENLNENDIEKIIQRYKDLAIKILSKFQKTIDEDAGEDEDRGADIFFTNDMQGFAI
jgi:hypothetical protein